MQRSICLSLIFVAVFLQQAAGQYDCRVFADGCSSGVHASNACTLSDGTCNCNTGDYYDCSVAATTATAAQVCTDQSKTCSTASGATYGCSGTGASTVCLCNAGFVTDSTVSATPCGVPRFGATCAAASATLRVYPFPGASFTGKISMMDQAGTNVVDCPLAAGSNPHDNRWEKAGMVYTGTPTGSCTLPATSGTAGTDLKYTFYLYYQQYASVQTTSDLKITVECTEPTAGAAEVVPAVSVAMANAPSPVTAGTQTIAATSGVTFAVYDTGSTSALTLPIPATSKVDAVFDVDLPSGGLFTQYVLTTLQAANNPFVTPVPNNNLAFYLIREACVDGGAGAVVTAVSKAKTGDVGRTIVTFGVFRFPAQADGYLAPGTPLGTNWLQATIVIGTYNRETVSGRACNEVTAAAGGPHLVDSAYADLTTAFSRRRRRRRDTSTGEEDIQSPVYLNLSVVMQDPFGTNTINSHHEVGRPIDDGSCYNTATFIVPLVVMGFLMVTAMFMMFHFCNRLNRHHGNQMDGTANMAYKS